MLDVLIQKKLEKFKKISPAFYIVRRQDLMTKEGKFEHFITEAFEQIIAEIEKLSEKYPFYSNHYAHNNRDKTITTFFGDEF